MNVEGDKNDLLRATKVKVKPPFVYIEVYFRKRLLEKKRFIEDYELPHLLTLLPIICKYVQM